MLHRCICVILYWFKKLNTYIGFQYYITILYYETLPIIFLFLHLHWKTERHHVSCCSFISFKLYNDHFTTILIFNVNNLVVLYIYFTNFKSFFSK
eukprot:UN04328